MLASSITCLTVSVIDIYPLTDELLCLLNKPPENIVEMASTVLEVGTGVFVVAVVWIAAAVFGMMLLRASGSAK